MNLCSSHASVVPKTSPNASNARSAGTGGDEVALDVIAFPINPADTLMIEGRYAVRPPLPSRVGAECIARVTATGKNAGDLREGDLVIPLDRDNWVRRKVCKAASVIKVPETSTRFNLPCSRSIRRPPI